jgi:hypothetical protein
MQRNRTPGATGSGTQIVVRVHAPLLAAIDAWRAAELDSPSRAEAFRRMATRVIAEDGAAKAKPRRPAKKKGKP